MFLEHSTTLKSNSDILIKLKTGTKVGILNRFWKDINQLLHRRLDCDWPLAYCSSGNLFKDAGSISSLGPKMVPSFLLLAKQGGQVSHQSLVGFGSHPHAPPRVNTSAPFRHICLRWEGHFGRRTTVRRVRCLTCRKGS